MDEFAALLGLPAPPSTSTQPITTALTPPPPPNQSIVPKAAPPLPKPKVVEQCGIEPCSYSHLRLTNRVMPSSTLPHLLSAPYTSFASLHLKCRDGTAPFSTMTLCHKKSECMRSKTNQSYATWTLGMLSNTTAKLLLFGHAFTAHHKNLAETGRAYLLIDPKPLPSSNGGPPTFSISRANQLHLYATAYDFTICKGVTNRTSNSAGGKPCSCVLDKRMGLYCEHHKAQGMTKVVEKKVFSKDTRSLKEGLGAGGMTANFAPKHAAPQHVMKPAQQVKPVAPRLMAPKHASNSLLNPNPRPSKPQPANPYQPKPTASATNSLLRASKPANPYAQKPASANPYAQKPAQVPKKKDAASQHKAMVSRVLQQKSNLSKPNLTRPYPPKPNLILPNQAAPAVDLLGQALSTTKALKSKLVARVTAKTKQVMLPYDGTYSGTVPIPQSRLPPSAAPTARSSHLLDLLAPPKEDELLEKQRELKQVRRATNCGPDARARVCVWAARFLLSPSPASPS